MKIAVIGSGEIKVDNINKYIPTNISLLISGGAKGIDTLAEKYADKNGIPKLIFKPNYKKYGKNAPIIRNKLIVESADLIIAIWNGVSNGTKFTIDYAKILGKRVKLVLIDITGTEILPGNLGKDCLGNGEHIDEKNETIECCCDECDYLKCCMDEMYSNKCLDCRIEYCPRKFE